VTDKAWEDARSNFDFFIFSLETGTQPLAMRNFGIIRKDSSMYCITSALLSFACLYCSVVDPDPVAFFSMQIQIRIQVAKPMRIRRYKSFFKGWIG
jgi:hypothetical protein